MKVRGKKTNKTQQMGASLCVMDKELQIILKTMLLFTELWPEERLRGQEARRASPSETSALLSSEAGLHSYYKVQQCCLFLKNCIPLLPQEQLTHFTAKGLCKRCFSSHLFPTPVVRRVLEAVLEAPEHTGAVCCVLGPCRLVLLVLPATVLLSQLEQARHCLRCRAPIYALVYVANVLHPNM